MNRFFSLALALLLLLGTIRGGATSISKFVSTNHIEPFGYAFWQSLVAALVLTLTGLRQTGNLPSIRLKDAKFYLMCGLVGTALPNAVFFESVRHIAAGAMAVLLTFVPIFIYLLVVLIRQEKIDFLRLGGILLGFAGALMIALQRVDGTLTLDGHVLFAMLCPLGYAIMGVYVGRFPLTGVHPFHLAAGTHLVAVAFLLPVSLSSGQFHPLWHDFGPPEAMMIVHGVMAGISYSLFFRIMELAGVVFYSMSHYVIALTGVAWGWLIFGETHGAVFWLAVVLILLGFSLVNQRQEKSRARLA